jgi:hypothetical protein
MKQLRRLFGSRRGIFKQRDEYVQGRKHTASCAGKRLGTLKRFTRRCIKQTEELFFLHWIARMADEESVSQRSSPGFPQSSFSMKA